MRSMSGETLALRGWNRSLSCALDGEGYLEFVSPAPVVASDEVDNSPAKISPAPPAVTAADGPPAEIAFLFVRRTTF
jgi:hypothetical protein